MSNRSLQPTKPLVTPRAGYWSRQTSLQRKPTLGVKRDKAISPAKKSEHRSVPNVLKMHTSITS